MGGDIEVYVSGVSGAAVFGPALLPASATLEALRALLPAAPRNQVAVLLCAGRRLEAEEDGLHLQQLQQFLLGEVDARGDADAEVQQEESPLAGCLEMQIVWEFVSLPDWVVVCSAGSAEVNGFYGRRLRHTDGLGNPVYDYIPAKI
eukprot:TRINITY_DN51835_c0_g1_i1.p2 TRINITY_DN51835_c0_g1~~TRINITY_DN51835_c0_g1_i1.p2  ORF type:complete len:147 (+),score=26.66 TRINITY_DN51835_c0_g1_i1:108-548(+)